MKIIFLFVSLVTSIVVWSQQKVPITATEKKALIDSLKKRLERYYVFPDKGKAMGQYLAKRSGSKAYGAIWDYNAFLDTLANDIDGVHHDPHLRLGFDPGYVRFLEEKKYGRGLTPERLEEEKAYYRKMNYGFQKVEQLPGNIGYIAVPQFVKVMEESETTLASAFEFIVNTDAVIIDVRSNNGSSPEMVHEVLSYFFDKPVHISSTYDTESGKTVENYSLATVKGKRLPDKKVFILTSENTFSAGEAFAFFMKNLKRAQIIGEVTAGAAHGEKAFVVNDKVVIQLPFHRAIDPVTKKDWEGVGVQPDVVIKADKALAKAQEMIIENALATVKNPREKPVLEWALVGVKAELTPATLTDQMKKEYAGIYGVRTIFIEGDQLMFQRNGGPKRKLFALSEDTFDVEGVDNYRVKFVRNVDGKVEKLAGLLKDGNMVNASDFLRTTKPD